MRDQTIIQKEKYGAIKRSQYPDKILVSGVVPAGQSKRFSTNISSLGDFLSMSLTGSFTTLGMSGGVIVDNGVCSLRAIIYDGTGMRQMLQQFTPLDLFLTPGRVKSSSGLNYVANYLTVLRADAASQIFHPDEFYNLFDAKSSIVVDCKNDSDADNTFNMCFNGMRLL